ncbi:glycosyltransferase [Flavobacterium sp. DG2-3]|uniref:glycosyltransferase n=1 Tax=Flavobacterium sp. DG2-3 TaxID=3068317 RepID=UPI00273FAE6C|nr:glycosyltransferase [Flavobacterium sp. DG2-3]MDP5200682.1 glycosyltransferase [Flavobacterium sp. DG2-3]
MIAIVVPYYNYLFFLQTLESLSLQTDKRFRVYIGDDCSPISPEEIISQFQTSLSVKYKRFENNLGHYSLSEHWNRCVDLIDNESWIMVLGDDDQLHHQVIENFYKNINDIEVSGSNLVRLSTIIVNENNLPFSQRYVHPKTEHAKDSMFRKMRNETRSSLTEYIFSRKSFERNRFKHYPLAWHSDDIAWLEFSEKKIIFTINEAIAYIRVTDHSISGNKKNTFLKREANNLFFIYIIKSDFNYTVSEFKYVINSFAHFLALYNKFRLKTLIFLVLNCIKNFQLSLTFSIIKKFFKYKVSNTMKFAKLKLKSS